MTAEVAVINRLCVVLAADSAVTIGSGEKAKIYQSANKLFELSDREPVGIMIYSSASFFGVPWEILIKEFRSEYTGCCQHLFEWKNCFVEFLTKKFIPSDESQFQNLYNQIEYVLMEVRERFFQRIYQILSDSNNGKLNDGKASLALQGVLTEIIDALPASDDFLSQKEIEQFIKPYEKYIEKLKSDVFDSFPFEEIHNELFLKVFERIVNSSIDMPNGEVTGIIIAGLGTDELFPSLTHFVISGVYANKFKVRHVEDYDVDRNSKTGTVFAFAQPDVAEQFMFGVDPAMERGIAGFFSDAIKGMSEVIRNRIEDLDGKAADEIAAIAGDYADHVGIKYLSQAGSELKAAYFSSIESIVQLMPKQEMAHLAESLVNITTLRRRISAEQETVGGPIDVAVISKHEGLVWIKRKHYFPSDINQRYKGRLARKFSYPNNTENEMEGRS